jgi:hypothetical protein
MAFDLTDPSGNTILVAVGTRSSFYFFGGPAIGLLYTQNALAPQPKWQVLDNQSGSINFRVNNVKFRSAFVRDNLMLAVAYDANPSECVNIGVFRSTDREITWTNVLLGIGLALAADPTNPNHFYATLDFTSACSSGNLPNNGVFTSADMGATWTFTSVVPGTIPIPEGLLGNAKLSVSSSNSRIWSALLKGPKGFRGTIVDSISYSDNQVGSWVKMDDVKIPVPSMDATGLNPGTQGGVHFSLLASPTNPNEVYVGGDRQPEPLPTFIGATEFSGNLFRGNASVTATGLPLSSQWEHMTDVLNQGFPRGGTASSSAPHADSRDMEIRADGSLLEGDDGGITVRTSPTDNTGDWFSVCGNMQVFETHNIA